MKTKLSAILIAFILGGFGGHKFYLGSKYAWIYLLFFWTGIPAIVAVIDIIILACLSEVEFNQKYNK